METTAQGITVNRLTAGRLIEYLCQFDDDAPVLFIDNDYNENHLQLCCNEDVQIAKGQVQFMDSGERFKATKWYVNFYLIDQAYGGSEEGGWYYTTRQALGHELEKSFDNEGEAYEYVKEVCNPVVDEMNEGRPPVYSVNSIGQYSFRIEEHKAYNQPSEKPHYE